MITAILILSSISILLNILVLYVIGEMYNYITKGDSYLRHTTTDILEQDWRRYKEWEQYQKKGYFT
jgi:hypothetical protein